MNLKPLQDRIVVEAAAKEEKSFGGIILPDSAPVKGPSAAPCSR